MSSNGAVAVRDANATTALAIRPGQEMFSDKQKAALAVLGIKDATNADLAVYMHYCQKTGLDPFSRQIYMICRREKQGNDWVAKQTIQVGIDGFRVIRDRIARREQISVEYEDTIWYDAGGAPFDVWLSEEPPTACKVTVVKDGRRFPGVVRTAAYMATRDGKPVSQWKTQPDHMIEKCAEAFALRRAFPHDLGGMYIEDELPPMPAETQRPQRVTRADIIEQRPVAEDPAPEPGPPARQRHDRGHPAASQAALDKLDKLLTRLPLGPQQDVAALLDWQCGETFAATRAHVKAVTGYLEDHLETAQGDGTAAASAIWEQYRNVHAQDAAGEGSQGGPGDG